MDMEGATLKHNAYNGFTRVTPRIHDYLTTA